jgi:hypothetical protein
MPGHEFLSADPAEHLDACQALQATLNAIANLVTPNRMPLGTDGRQQLIVDVSNAIAFRQKFINETAACLKIDKPRSDVDSAKVFEALMKRLGEADAADLLIKCMRMERQRDNDELQAAQKQLDEIVDSNRMHSTQSEEKSKQDQVGLAFARLARTVANALCEAFPREK